VTTDVEHHGEVVPEGSVMLFVNASGNRDDRKFPDGDSFDIRRKIDHHLSFGYGLHFCLGAALARLDDGWPSTRCFSASRPGRSTGTTRSRPGPPPCGAGRSCRSGPAERAGTMNHTTNEGEQS
jgi:hypothetical protein